jgi:hypothetical protein
MRKSILALALGGALAATAFAAVPAEARHVWSPEFGWRTGHYQPRPARRTVFVNPDGSRTVVRERRGRTVIRNPDGSRTIIRRAPQQAYIAPRAYYGY